MCGWQEVLGGKLHVGLIVLIAPSDVERKIGLIEGSLRRQQGRNRRGLRDLRDLRCGCRQLDTCLTERALLGNSRSRKGKTRHINTPAD
jgi:hypothetical protein